MALRKFNGEMISPDEAQPQPIANEVYERLRFEQSEIIDRLEYIRLATFEIRGLTLRLWEVENEIEMINFRSR